MSIIHRAQAATMVACINNARVDLGVPFHKLTAALQKCYDRHFLPVWGYPVRLYNAERPKPTDWQLLYFDDAGAASASGYHGLTKHGQPVSTVFVKPARAEDLHVSLAASRALFQMVIDPAANLWAEAADGTLYAYDVSDPVEEDTFMIDGLPMSNFVYPSWFEPFWHPRARKFDHLSRLTKPFSMTKGGYATVKKGDRTSVIFGSQAKQRRFSRSDRRGRRSEYRRSSGQRIRRPRTVRDVSSPIIL